MNKSTVVVAVKTPYFIVRQDLGGKPGLEMAKKRSLEEVQGLIAKNSWKINSTFSKETATQVHEVMLADVGYVAKVKVAKVAEEVSSDTIGATKKSSKGKQSAAQKYETLITECASDLKSLVTDMGDDAADTGEMVSDSAACIIEEEGEWLAKYFKSKGIEDFQGALADDIYSRM